AYLNKKDLSAIYQCTKLTLERSFASTWQNSSDVQLLKNVIDFGKNNREQMFTIADETNENPIVVDINDNNIGIQMEKKDNQNEKLNNKINKTNLTNNNSKPNKTNNNKNNSNKYNKPTNNISTTKNDSLN